MVCHPCFTTSCRKLGSDNPRERHVVRPYPWTRVSSCWVFTDARLLARGVMRRTGPRGQFPPTPARGKHGGRPRGPTLRSTMRQMAPCSPPMQGPPGWTPDLLPEVTSGPLHTGYSGQPWMDVGTTCACVSCAACQKRWPSSCSEKSLTRFPDHSTGYRPEGVPDI